MNPERWQQIEGLYNSAMELDPDRRESFLRKACAGDESLLREVATMLAQETNAQGLFESPALDDVARAIAEDEAQKRQLDLSGSTLLHYRIEEKIGEGGMGEVYRAEDTTLSRHVAIKFLPDIFSGDPGRLARFEREAKSLASLNHQNIASIHGLEQVEGKRFLVLELVEGQTLAQRILGGPIPVDEALEICRQIAQGLEAAHEKGIIHRDLKPANVQITRGGKIKILDFGLAKARQADPADLSSQNEDSMTASGVILGTAAYMSPEQAKGKPVDKRADIWGFGCVLYECLAGERAFQGETITEIVASVLKSEPEWTLLPVETPALIRSLLRRCLQKDPSQRLHDIADARIEIGESIGQPAEVPAVHRAPLGWLVAVGAAILLIGLVVGAAVMNYFKPAASRTSQPVARSPSGWSRDTGLMEGVLERPMGWIIRLERPWQFPTMAASSSTARSRRIPGRRISRACT